LQDESSNPVLNGLNLSQQCISTKKYKFVIPLERVFFKLKSQITLLPHDEHKRFAIDKGKKRPQNHKKTAVNQKQKTEEKQRKKLR